MDTTRAGFRPPVASDPSRRTDLPPRHRFSRRDDRCDSGSPRQTLHSPDHPAACAALRPVPGRPGLPREVVGQSPPQQAATGWQMKSRRGVVPARMRRPHMACYRHPTSVPSGPDPCGPVRAPGRPASRLVDRLRLPASRPSAPPPGPKTQRFCDRPLPATRTRYQPVKERQPSRANVGSRRSSVNDGSREKTGT